MFAMLGYVSPSEGDEGALGGRKLTGSRSPSGERGAEWEGRLQEQGLRREIVPQEQHKGEQQEGGRGVERSTGRVHKNKRELPPREYL